MREVYQPAGAGFPIFMGMGFGNHKEKIAGYGNLVHQST